MVGLQIVSIKSKAFYDLPITEKNAIIGLAFICARVGSMRAFVFMRNSVVDDLVKSRHSGENRSPDSP